MPGTRTDHEAAVDSLDEAFRSEGRPERAEQEKRYLKSALHHHGVSVPVTRRLLKAWRARRARFERATVRGFVDEAWSRGVHELRVAAVEQLAHDAALLEPDDLAWLEQLLREARTWALVDPLAIHVVGGLCRAHPAVAPGVEGWATDHDFWLRRTALLVHLLPMRRGDAEALEPFARVAEPLLGDREFFIRKAIGWVLRDRAKQLPDEVFEWLLERAPRASGLTLREASKPLTETQRARLKAARGAASRALMT